MKTFCSALAALALVPPSLCALQHTSREPAPASPVMPGLGAPFTEAHMAIASEGELSAVLFEDDASERVYVAVSDGRALTFDAPVRIDTDPGVHDKFLKTSGSNEVLAVRGTAIYATWRDERNAGPGGAGGDEAVDVYFARSLDGGVSWESDKPVPKGYSPGGLSPVMAHALAVSDSGQDVYVLQLVDPNYFGGTKEEIWLTASHDGGATFAPAVKLAELISHFWYNTVALELDGDDVHVAFTGQLPTTPGSPIDVYHLVAPKAVGFAPTPTLIDGPGDGVSLALTGVALAARNGVVALAWEQEADWGGGHPFVYAAVSTDGGAAFTPPTPVGSPPPGPLSIESVTVSIAADGIVVLAWTDDRFGTLSGQTSVFATRSTDGGTTFEPETEVAPFDAASGDAARPKLAGAGRDVTLTWRRWDAFEGAFSRDSALTWTPTSIDITGPHPAIGSMYGIPQSAYNVLYDNALAVWVGLEEGNPAATRMFAGGYRLPELLPVGFASGGVAHVDLASLSGDAPLAWVVFAASLGDLPLPFGDGRNLGLAFDALLSLSLASPALLLVPLAPGGTGSTGSFAIPLAPGTELYAAAVSLSLAPAVVLDEITDVVAITVQ